MTDPRPLRIGCASGFWGDSSVGAPQLVASGEIDVLVFDYLAETTMAILAAAQRKNPQAGYATDFVDTGVTLTPVTQRVYQSIPIVSSACTHRNVIGSSAKTSNLVVSISRYSPAMSTLSARICSIVSR